MFTSGDKRRARYTAYNALARGDIARQCCEQCGKAEAQMHHEDYSQPLDVRWLCRSCHMSLHPRPVLPVPEWFKAAASQHFEDGVPYRVLAAQLGVPAGTAYHWLRKLRE